MIACHFKVIESVSVFFFLKKPHVKHNITLGFERNCRLIANCCFFLYLEPIGTGRFFFLYRIETVRFRIRQGNICIPRRHENNFDVRTHHTRQ